MAAALLTDGKRDKSYAIRRARRHGPARLANAMLYLTRKIGESVVINDTIEVTVIEVRGKSIKLGFTFPPEATVLRREIYERIQAENRAAAEASARLTQSLGAAPQDETDTAPQPATPMKGQRGAR
jgi:carbon storage regulator